MAVPAWFVWAGRCCRAHSPLFVGTALQNKFTTVPETKLPPLTLHFPVQNGRKTCWRNSRAAQIFCNPSPNTSPESPLGAPSPDDQSRRRGGDSGTQLMVTTPALCSRTHGSASKLHLSTGETNANLCSEREETPNEKDRMSVKLCNYQQVNYSYRFPLAHSSRHSYCTRE